jgi:hypothetical protein
MIILLSIQIIRDEYQPSIVENSHFEYIHSQLRMVMSVTDIVQQENLYHLLIITSFVVEPRILFLTPSILFGTNTMPVAYRPLKLPPRERRIVSLSVNGLPVVKKDMSRYITQSNRRPPGRSKFAAIQRKVFTRPPYIPEKEENGR